MVVNGILINQITGGLIIAFSMSYDCVFTLRLNQWCLWANISMALHPYTIISIEQCVCFKVGGHLLAFDATKTFSPCHPMGIACGRSLVFCPCANMCMHACACISERRHPFKMPFCCRDELCFFLISDPADLTSAFCPNWSPAINWLLRVVSEFHFLRTLQLCRWAHNTFCIHQYWLCRNDIWWRPAGFWCPHFHLPQSCEMYSSIRLTISWATYHKINLFFSSFLFPSSHFPLSQIITD